MFYKKIFTSLLVFLMVLSNIVFTPMTAKAVTDVALPILSSMSVDKISVVAGESVKVTLGVTNSDGSGIKDVTIFYRSPLTNKSKSISMKNISGDIYEGTLSLSSIDEIGTWKATYVSVTDNLGNAKHKIGRAYV